ncbi:MAG: DUF1549 domain-containing protein, partial [Planctomycetota bacterium]
MRCSPVTRLCHGHAAFVFAVILGAIAPVCRADDNARAEFFENQVRPLLVERCYECHAAEEAEAGLQLDSQAGWKVGGDSGSAIIPGDPDSSLLMEAVRYSEEVIAGMPPDAPLSDSEVAVLSKWIADGAYDPRTSVSPSNKRGQFDLEGRRQEHWSWRPITSPKLPDVARKDWSRDPLDRFILAGIEKAGLVPAEDAEDLVWLRRVCFDLTGLPPTPDQIKTFRDLPNELLVRCQAREAVVDQLLQSATFGEKWARHWMDLVRYAESFGHEFDYTIPHAFEYRDYLIRAFNADVPYDDLIVEHIAGDLLAEPRSNPEEGFNESVIATGFWHLHEATHAPTDILQNEADIAANQIDIFGKTFLGLTVACARCHDHKFDAISTADFYAMFSYLQSSRRVERPLDPNGTGRGIVEDVRQLRQEFAADIDGSRPVPPVEGVWSSESGERYEGFGHSELEGWVNVGHAFASVPDGAEHWISAGNDPHASGTIDSAYFGEQASGSLQSPTFELPEGKIHVRVRSDANQLIRVVIDNYQLAPDNALLFRGTLFHRNQTDTKGQWKWLTFSGDLSKYAGHRAFLEFVDPGPGSIAIDEVWFSREGPPTAADAPRLSHDSQVQARISEFEERLKTVVSRWPKPRRVLAMAEGSPIRTPVYIRGSHTNPGDSVPRRSLEALGGMSGSRIELARQIASDSNPLTSRVFVNRVWHQVFGRGIVESVDDFGPQGTLRAE